MGRLVTKYCSPESAAKILKGSVRIGSHAGYSKAEATGTQSDYAEGEGLVTMESSPLPFSGCIKGMTFVNCKADGYAGAAVKIEEQFNSSVFCVSKDKYSLEQHKAIIDGDPENGYPPNPSYTAYVEFSLKKLSCAIQRAGDNHFGRETTWISDEVTYGNRETKLLPGAIINHSGFARYEYLLRLAFTKPERFKLENEYRFLLLPQIHMQIPEAFSTGDLSRPVRRAFKNAIKSWGNI